MEQLQDRVHSKLWTLDKDELVKVCLHLKCSEPVDEGFSGLTKRALIRIVERTLEEIEEGEDMEQYSTCLNELLCLSESFTEPAEPAASPAVLGEIETVRKEYAELQQAQANARQILEKKLRLLEEMQKKGKEGTGRREVIARHNSVPEVTLR